MWIGWRGWTGVLVGLAAATGVWLHARQEPAAPAPAVISPSGQRIYDGARPRLLQVRTLLKDQDSQASVGSGFLVSDEGHIITNYHVVSQAALQPDRYRLMYSTADRAEGPLQLLAFDAVHDLALVRPVEVTAFAGRTPLRFRAASSALAQGERIFSLGNPLDVGFAVIEGTYNGLVERSFYRTIFFAGSLNPGVSGGPTLDSQGAVIGVNVAARTDGEQVSFLVPAEFAEALLERHRQTPPVTTSVYPELTTQLTAHQATLTERFTAQPWRTAAHERYRIPMPQETFLRCWGASSPADAKGLQFQRSDCGMDSQVFVSGFLTTGSLGMRHELYDGTRLGVLRFAHRYSASFMNEMMGTAPNASRTAPQCHERYVDREGIPFRAVICLQAYRKLTGLYDVATLVAAVDQPRHGLLGRFDARGVTFANALALSQHYLDGFGRR